MTAKSSESFAHDWPREPIPVAYVRVSLSLWVARQIDLPTTGGHRTNTSAAIALEPGSTPANGRESAISVEGLAKRFGNLEAVSRGSGRWP